MSARRRRTGAFNGEPFISHRLSMRKSVAWQHLSDNGRRVLDRLEIEHSDHGGRENGKLTCTFDDFVRAGLRRQSIAPAIRECVELGFAEITYHARPAVAEHRRASQYRLTYIVGRHPSPEPTNEWEKIVDPTEATAAIQRARTARSAEHVRRADPRVVRRLIQSAHPARRYR